MKVLFPLIVVVAVATALPFADYGDDDGQYHPDPSYDDGQYHEDDSGEYHPDNEGNYYDPYVHIEGEIVPYKHTPDEQVPYIPFKDSYDYKYKGEYNQKFDKDSHKDLATKAPIYPSLIHNSIQGFKQNIFSNDGGLRSLNKGQVKGVITPRFGEENKEKQEITGIYISKSVPSVAVESGAASSSGVHASVIGSNQVSGVATLHKATGQGVVNAGVYKAVVQTGADDGQYHHDNSGEYNEQQATDGEGQYKSKTTVLKTAGQSGGHSSVFSSVRSNTQASGVAPVPVVAHKTVVNKEVDDGQYHHDTSGHYNKQEVTGQYQHTPQSQYNSKTLQTTSVFKTSGQSGVVPSVVPTGGHSSVFSSLRSNTQASGVAPVPVVAHKTVVNKEVDDGQYHHDTSGHYNKQEVTGQYQHAPQGQYNSKTLQTTSVFKTSGQSGVVPSVVPTGGHSSVFSSLRSNTQASGVAPVPVVAHKTVVNKEVDDGQYHHDTSGHYNKQEVTGQYQHAPQGQYNSKTLQTTSVFKTSGQSGVVPSVVPTGGHSSVFSSLRSNTQASGVAPVPVVAHKTVVNKEVDDGQYHHDTSGHYNKQEVTGQYQHAPQGQYNSKTVQTTSVFKTAGQSGVVPSVVPTGGHSSVFSSVRSNTQTSGVAPVPVVAHKTVVNKEVDDGQYHHDTSGHYNKQEVTGQYQHAPQGQYNSKTVQTTSVFKTAGQSGVVPSVVPTGGHSSVFSSVRSNTQASGVAPVPVVAHKTVVNKEVDDGQYHHDTSGHYNKQEVTGQYQHAPQGQYNSKTVQTTSVFKTTGQSGVVPSVVPTGGHSSVFSSVRSNTQASGVAPVPVVAHKTVVNKEVDDGQYHHDTSGHYNKQEVTGQYQHAPQGQYNSKTVQTTSVFKTAGQSGVVPSVVPTGGHSSVFSSVRSNTQTSGVAPVPVVAHKTVVNKEVDDGQYHHDTSGHYNKQEVTGQYQHAPQGQYNSKTVQTTSVFKTAGQSGVVPSVVPTGGHSSVFSSVRSNTQASGVAPVPVVAHKTVVNKEVDDGQYHHDTSGHYNKQEVTGQYQHAPQGQYNSKTVQTTSVFKTTGQSGVVPSVVPTGGHSSVFSSVRSNTQASGVAPVPVVAHKTVVNKEVDDGQYHHDTSGHYNKQEVTGQYQHAPQGQYNSKTVQTTSVFKTAGQSGVVPSVVPTGGHSSVFSSVRSNTQTSGVAPVPVVAHKTVVNKEVDDGQYHHDTSGHYNKQEVTGQYQHAPQGQYNSKTLQTTSVFKTAGQSGVVPSVVPTGGHSSVFSSVRSNTQTSGVAPVPVVAHKTVVNKEVDDGQYHHDTSGQYNKQEVTGQYQHAPQGQYNSKTVQTTSVFKTTGQSGVVPSVVPTGGHSSVFSSVRSNTQASGVAPVPVVAHKTVVNKEVDDGQYHHDTSGHYNKQEVTGQYQHAPQGQYNSKTVQTTSVFKTTGQSGVVPSVVPTGGHSSVFSSVRSNTQASGVAPVPVVAHKTVVNKEVDDGQYHHDTSGHYNKQEVTGQYQHAPQGQYNSKTVQTTSVFKTTGQSGVVPSFVPTGGHSSVFSSVATSGHLSNQAADVHKTGTNVQYTKQFQTRFNVESSSVPVPKSLKEMQEVHLRIQKAVVAKYGEKSDLSNIERSMGVVKKVEEYSTEGYHYIYATEKGIVAEEIGHLSGEGSSVHLEVKGFYFFIGTDNVIYSVEYTADSSTGYVPIFRGLVKNATLKKTADFCLKQ